MKTQKPDLKWTWFKYAGIRSATVLASSGRKIQLRLNDVFGIKESTKVYDMLAVPGERIKTRMAIVDSEKLMAKSRAYRGRVDWPELLDPKPKAAPTVKLQLKAKTAPIISTPKPRIVISKPERIHIKVKTDGPGKQYHYEPGADFEPQVMTPNRSRGAPLLDLDEDYDDVSNLGIDFNSQSGELVPGGVYVSVTPDAESVLRLHRLVRLVRFLDLDQDFHCTVLYSRNKESIVGEPEQTSQNYGANVVRAASWSGHDGKSYLVLMLATPQLVALNESWMDLGYTQDFDPYKPHITLKTDVDVFAVGRALAILNNFIRLHPAQCEITFGPAVTEPLRD